MYHFLLLVFTLEEFFFSLAFHMTLWSAVFYLLKEERKIGRKEWRKGRRKMKNLRKFSVTPKTLKRRQWNFWGEMIRTNGKNLLKSHLVKYYNTFPTKWGVSLCCLMAKVQDLLLIPKLLEVIKGYPSCILCVCFLSWLHHNLSCVG